MPRYMIDAGNSTDGAVGFVLRLIAKTPEAALKQAKRDLPEHICGDGGDLRVYFNADALTLADVREEE